MDVKQSSRSHMALEFVKGFALAVAAGAALFIILAI